MTINVKDYVERLFYKAMLNELKEDRPDIHVTDLVYDCLRRAYYYKKYPSRKDSAEMMVLWIGKKLHEMPMVKEDTSNVCLHEYPVAYQEGNVKIVGSIDELCKLPDGTWVVIDKKTTRSVPRQAYDHHIKQTLIYSAILSKTTEMKVSQICILYIDVSNLMLDAKCTKIDSFMLEKALKEAMDKAKILYKALKENRPPPPVRGWWCKYCDYFEQCLRDD